MKHKDDFPNFRGGYRSFLTSSLPSGIAPIPALCLLGWTLQCFETDGQKDENVLTG